MPGPPPKPTALKQLQGNPGKRRLNRHEPKPTGIPTCPKHLDREAKREWKRISAELITLGLLTNVDRAALASYCTAYSRWVAAELAIQKFGVVIKSPKSGFPIQNPYVGVANTAVDQMRKFATEFGLTPASRTRLQVNPDAAPTDTFDSFMSGIGGDDVESMTTYDQGDSGTAIN
jgi:P27 family predicted phage terminase small subunit